MITFKVGDKINHHMCGMGTIICVHDNQVIVAFNEKTDSLTHSCSGMLQNNNGRYFYHDYCCDNARCASVSCLKPSISIYTLWNDMMQS